MTDPEVYREAASQIADTVQAVARKEARAAVASFAGVMLEAIGEDPSAPLASKIASGLGAALQKFGDGEEEGVVG